MKTDFDKKHKIDFSGFVKFNPVYLKGMFGNTDVLPFWVAETDFKTVPEVIEALIKTAKQGMYGYQYKTPDLKKSLTTWFKKRHNLTMNTSGLLFTTSVLTGLAGIIDEFTVAGDGVIIQPPVYSEFQSIIKNLNRQVVNNPLKITDGNYRIDFEYLEEKASAETTRIMILCNPHNPVGRVWTAEELIQVSDICIVNKVLLLSDEIHSDIIYSGHTFNSIMSLEDEHTNASIMLGSPGKTFGIPGISDAFIYAPNNALRETIKSRIMRFRLGKSNAFTNAATQAAWLSGGEWLDGMISYLENTIQYIDEFLNEELPEVAFTRPEGTYQVWLDFRKTGLDEKALKQMLTKKAMLGLNMGRQYGEEGAGFARMNIASPLPVIQQAMEQLRTAINIR